MPVRKKAQVAQATTPTTGQQAQKPDAMALMMAALGTKGIQGVIDSVMLGTIMGITMVWNSSRAPGDRILWVLAELLFGGWAVSASEPGLFRNVALGLETGAIGTILAPMVCGGGTSAAVAGRSGYARRAIVV